MSGFDIVAGAADSAHVPPYCLLVFDSIALGDFDTPHERCGSALRWLSAAGLVYPLSNAAPGKGQSWEGMQFDPATLTEAGRALARERGILVAGASRGN